MAEAETLMRDVRVAIRLLRIRRRRLERALDNADENGYAAESPVATAAPTETPRPPQTAKESNYFAASKVAGPYILGPCRRGSRHDSAVTGRGQAAILRNPRSSGDGLDGDIGQRARGAVRDSTSSADFL
jgi:hypothetical protein